MSGIRVQVRPRPAGWADVPSLDRAQEAVRDRARIASLVVRGAPGSGRTTCALAVMEDAAERGERAILLVPDRVRADALTPRVQALAPQTVRPVRTPASFAYSVVSAWRLNRHDPLGPVELVTGALQDELIAELLEAVPAPWPDSLLPEMRTIPAFRDELRDLFARAGEVGFDGAALADAGYRFAHPEWAAAGALLEAYLSGESFSVEHRDVVRVDLARIQSLAAELIDAWEADAPERGVDGAFEAPDLVVVDDLQDCTPSTIRLLTSLVNAGSRVVAFADPDVAIAGYRGGEPHLDGRLSEAINAEAMDLGAVHCQGPRLRACVSGIVENISQTGSPARRSAEGRGAPDPDAVRAHIGGSNAQLGAHIAHALRQHRLHDSIPWTEQAVIVRSAAQAEEFARYLRRGGVPVEGGARAFDFAAHATTRALLELIAGQDRIPEEQRARLLVSSPLIELDGLELHRFLAGLNALEPAARDDDDEEHADFLIGVSRLLDDPSLWRDRARGALPGDLERAHRLWRERDGVGSLRPQEALWRMWELAERSEPWREGALKGDDDSAWFDDQLDALVALMRVADVWEQRNPSGTAAEFARGLLDRQVPIDTIALVGVRPPGVAVLTPAQAVGRHWTVVALVGLQDGVWPNTRLRTRTLRGDLITELGTGRIADSWDGSAFLDDNPKNARKEVLNDERRLLAAAVSRCTGVLHIGAVSAEDAAPSVFFEQLAASAGLEGEDAPILSPAPAPLSIFGQIADLRRCAARGDDEAECEEAALLLALLWREGVVSADPATWTGEGPLSSSEPIASGVVRLSPSKFESAMKCPLKWFFSDIGAEGPAGDAQRIGTLIHAIAEKAPHGDGEALEELFQAELRELDIDTGTWEGQAFVEKARRRLENLASYFVGVPGDVDTETPIDVRIGDAVIGGRIDRIEKVDEGVRIVDLKSGSAISVSEAELHPQLALYQLALAELGFDVVGARLVYLNGNKPAERHQKAFDEETRERWLDALKTVSGTLRASAFVAKPDRKTCQHCSFTKVCPADERGRKTVD